MKTKKAVLVLLTAFCLVTLCFSQSYAAYDWYLCKVDQVGPYGIIEGTSGSYIYLTSSTGAWAGSIRCSISPIRGKEYLAVALTAIASDKQVNVYMNLLTAPAVRGIYVQK